MLRHSCGYKLANDSHDTLAIQHYLGPKLHYLNGALHRIGGGSLQASGRAEHGNGAEWRPGRFMEANLDSRPAPSSSFVSRAG
jgi:hypothetical protein